MQWATVFFIGLLISSVAQAQIISDTTTEGARKKFTVQCEFSAGFANHGWGRIKRKYTIHYTKTALYTSNPKINGWYAWSTDEWLKFEEVDDNHLWLLRHSYEAHDDASICQSSCGSGFVEYSYSRGIDKRTLEMVVEARGFTPKIPLHEKDFSKDADDYDSWSNKRKWLPLPRLSGPCKLLPYEEPPRNLLD